MENKHLTPKYVQIKEILKKRILNKEYLRGERLPSERELSKLYGTSRMTARKALSELVNEGFAFRSNRSGTFVAYPKIERDLLKLSGFSQMLKDKGIESSNKLLKSRQIKADKRLCEIFNVSMETMFYEIVRIRYGNGFPLSLEYTYVQVKDFPNLLEYDLSKESLYRLFESCYNQDISHAKQWLSLYKASDEEAKNLEIPAETCIILFEAIAYNVNGIPIEFTKSLSRGDQCTFYTELRK